MLPCNLVSYVTQPFNGEIGINAIVGNYWGLLGVLLVHYYPGFVTS